VKFLIIRFSSIGDIVLTSPVPRLLRKRFPEAEIHFVTKQSNASLFFHNPNVDKVIILEKTLLDLIKILRTEKYDYIIDLHKNFRSRLIKLMLRRKSFTFNKLNFKKWLLVKLRINCLPKVHIVDRYVDTLKFFGISNDNLGLDFFISDNTQFPQKFSLQEPYLALVLGANHATKKIPQKKMQYVCQNVKGKIILLGGKAEREDGRQLELVYPNVKNACGTLGIYQSTLILKNAAMVLTNDTGLMHIAAALKKDIVSIWGNTVPEFGMYPYLAGEKSRIFQVENLPCRPCSKIGYPECPKKHFRCMNCIDYDDVVQYINSIM
jgi:ADP-heptose:LPS heptosyltransferase